MREKMWCLSKYLRFIFCTNTQTITHRLGVGGETQLFQKAYLLKKKKGRHLQMPENTFSFTGSGDGQGRVYLTSWHESRGPLTVDINHTFIEETKTLFCTYL